jgi:hypothetical protein
MAILRNDGLQLERYSHSLIYNKPNQANNRDKNVNKAGTIEK